jgi:hypothetical protein
VPRVFDTFMLADELDVLECRLTELEDVDVTHVLVEATLNHQGKPKPLWYADNKARFERWRERVVHVVVSDLDPHDDSAWGRENAQREFTWQGLQDAEPDDIIIHSDADEILSVPTVNLAQAIGLQGGSMRYWLRHFIFACDWEIQGGEVWDKPVSTQLKNIDSFTDLRRSNGFMTASGGMGPDIRGGMGWHLSFFGGPDSIRRKLQRDCHPEMRNRMVKYLDDGLCFEKGLFPFDVQHAVPVEPDRTWPRYIREGRAPAAWFRPRDRKLESAR